jgi:hypothetical protein
LSKLSAANNIPAASDDRSLDGLLDLDGFVTELGGGYWVKIVAKRVPPCAARPNGISYSLSLFDPNDRRIMGYDNAHPVRTSRGPAGGQRKEHDHQHRGEAVRPYDYTDAATLLGQFWEAVNKVLKEEGIP